MIPGYRAEHDLVALAVSGLLNAFDEFGMEGAPHMHRHAKMPGPVQLQQARRSVRPIAQLLGNLEDTRSCRVARPGCATEDYRNECLGDTCGRCDIRHGWRDCYDC